ncbi:hypothetical protein HMPREF9439_00564 [Parasutterella excrementihominis YIT 11859]|uniref:Uncharacterized protein n=1 Tax=Parasutterella excrementihominis YIT 11859 TaxID=762966 RepID=F3QI17_9BURK|nr:hypothetical protein HMPREF9439_00564 [Parasutterella excrementihominis YIT 11859]
MVIPFLSSDSGHTSPHMPLSVSPRFHTFTVKFSDFFLFFAESLNT